LVYNAYRLNPFKEAACNFSNVSKCLKPEQLQEAFEQWVSELIGNKTFMASVDGKAMRNVKGKNGLALMLVNVFANEAIISFTNQFEEYVESLT
jgi:hypothetical protein